MFALICCLSCSRDNAGIKLTAPFNDETVIGGVAATWRNTGEERGFAAGVRLAEPEVRFQYRVDATNKLGDKLFVRLAKFELLGDDGLARGADDSSVECTLPAGGTQSILAGDVWMPKHAAADVRRFRISHFAVPLSERGRGLYRGWRLEGRPGATAEVDAEIAGYAAAAGCVAR